MEKSGPDSLPDFNLQLKGRWILAVFDPFDDSTWLEFREGSDIKRVFAAALVLDRTDGNLVLYIVDPKDPFGEYRVLPYKSQKITFLSREVNLAQQTLQLLYKNKIERFQPLA